MMLAPSNILRARQALQRKLDSPGMRDITYALWEVAQKGGMPFQVQEEMRRVLHKMLPDLVTPRPARPPKGVPR